MSEEPLIDDESREAFFATKRERNKFIVDWLVEDQGIPKWQAKAMVKLFIGPLTSLLGDVTERGVEKIDGALKGKSETYDKVAGHISKLLLKKVECRDQKKKYEEWHLEPPVGEDPENWKSLNEETKIWISQCNQLDLIALSLGELKARVRLVIDPPVELGNDVTSKWLRPWNTLIPLTGRDSEKKQLKSWADGEELFSWRVIIGEGGMGKTRLAQEFAQDCMEDYWDTGFLYEVSLVSLVDHDGFANWSPLVDTLIVVDYAAAKQDSLKKLIHQCATVARNGYGQEETSKIRLLFLERHASKEDGWVKTLLDAGEGALHDEIGEAFQGIEELQLPQEKSASDTMMEILQTTSMRWGELTEKTVPDLPDFTEENLQKLKENTEGRPLYLQMAALHACEIGSTGELFHWNRTTLLKDAVKRERRYIPKFCDESKTTPLVERLTALLYFAGQIPSNDPGLKAMIEEEAETQGYNQTATVEIVNALRQLWQSEEAQAENKLAPISPDLIGAAFASTVLEEQGNIEETLNRSIRLGGKTAWENLMRSTQDLYSLGDLSMESWLPSLIENKTKEELLEIAVLIPWKTVSLRSFNVDLLEALLPFSENEAEKAGILNNLGRSYSLLGFRKEGLDKALRSVAIRERLSKDNPDAFELGLAGSYNNLGIGYREVGRREEALEVTLKAVEIFERLCEMNPDLIEPELAGSYHSLGVGYNSLGQRQEALESTLKAVEIRKRLSGKYPDKFEPGLATSYNNLGNIYHALGSFHEALKASLLAIEILEPLSQSKQDAFETDLAMSFNNHSRSLKALGQCEEALEASLKALAIRERLYRKKPEAFEADLAGTYNNLATVFNELDRREDALETALKGFELYKHLVEKNGEAFEPELALILNNLGAFYQKLGRGNEAIESVLEAIAIRERISEKNPDAFEPDLATSCGNLGFIHLQEGNNIQAEKFYLRGVKILNRLFQKSPKAFARLMASLVKDYINCCEKSGSEPDKDQLAQINSKIVGLIND